jgi:hypothetical protein
MESGKGNAGKVQKRGTKSNGAGKGEALSLLSQVIDLMSEKKALHVKCGEIEVHLSPMAFKQDEVKLDNLGNDAENIDSLLNIKRPKGASFPRI